MVASLQLRHVDCTAGSVLKVSWPMMQFSQTCELGLSEFSSPSRLKMVSTKNSHSLKKDITRAPSMRVKEWKRNLKRRATRKTSPQFPKPYKRGC